MPRREDEAVAEGPPEDGDQPGAAETLGHDRQDVLAPDQAAVEQRQAGQGHEEHQRRRGHHPGVVAGPRRRQRLGGPVGDVGLEIGDPGREIGRRGRGGRRRRLRRREPGVERHRGEDGQREEDGPGGRLATPSSGEECGPSFPHFGGSFHQSRLNSLGGCRRRAVAHTSPHSNCDAEKDRAYTVRTIPPVCRCTIAVGNLLDLRWKPGGNVAFKRSESTPEDRFAKRGRALAFRKAAIRGAGRATRTRTRKRI